MFAQANVKQHFPINARIAVIIIIEIESHSRAMMWWENRWWEQIWRLCVRLYLNKKKIPPALYPSQCIMKFCILPRAIIISSAKESHFLHWDTDQRRRLEFHTHDNDFIRISHSIQGITYIFQLAVAAKTREKNPISTEALRKSSYEIPQIYPGNLHLTIP